MSFQAALQFAEQVLPQRGDFQEGLRQATSPQEFTAKFIEMAQGSGITLTESDVALALAQRKINDLAEQPTSEKIFDIAGSQQVECPLGTRFTACFTVSGCWRSIC
jgi:hypothetical protein